jgi:FtsP/CotA-like multicopper oxidase with cupredoxin domain
MDGRRATILIVTAVLAVVAFLVLRPSGDDDDDSKRGAPTAQPAPTTTTTTTPAETQPTPEAQPKEPAVKLIRVRGGRPVGGIQTIEASEGDTVRFRVQTEAPQEIHLHGYDISEETTADRPAEFRFKADESGIFEIEIEDTATQIAELKVEP